MTLGLVAGAAAWLAGMTAFRAVCAARLPIPHDPATLVCVGSPPNPVLVLFGLLAVLATAAAWAGHARLLLASAVLFAAGTVFPVLLSELRGDLAWTLVPSAVLLLASAWRAAWKDRASAAA